MLVYYSVGEKKFNSVGKNYEFTIARATITFGHLLNRDICYREFCYTEVPLFISATNVVS